MPIQTILTSMTYLLTFVWVMVATPVHAEQKATELSVQALSLSITRPVPGVDKDSDLASFNGQEGTEVKLLINAKGKGLIKLDKDASKVTAFTDDKGNNLISGKGFGSFEGFAWFRASKDGKVATIDVTGRKTPGKGASSLVIKGKLVFQAASKKSTHRHTKAALVKGTKIKAGPVNCEISEAGKPDWGDSEWSVTLKFDGERPPISELRFLDAKGNELKSSSAGSSRTKIFSKVTSTMRYRIDKKVPAATIEFVLWDDIETVVLPLDMKVGLGR